MFDRSHRATFSGRRPIAGIVCRVASLSPLQEMPSGVDNMKRIERALEEAVTADDPFLTEIASHLLLAGGKRLRPAFALTSALVGEPDPVASDAYIQAAISVELVHLGSLYHDDVMDDAETRHAVESVNFRWGNLKAILAGDFLLAKASEIAAARGIEVAELLAATIGRLCEGQIRELQRIYDLGRTEEQYFEAIGGKTASLYATACRIGGLVGGRPRAEVDLLTDFGWAYGMAFQVVDDILDLTASNEQLGKPAGNDLVEGVYTLPVIRFLATQDAARLTELLGKKLSFKERDEAREILRGTPVVASSVETAVKYCDQAVSLVDQLPDTPAVRGMRLATQNLMTSLPD